jgi:hypothetical protein
MSTEEVISNIYKKAQEIIRSEEIFFKHTFKQIDIFKQKHYDGKAKLGTSLKWLQFTMGFNNIEEMPIPHTQKDISDTDIKAIINYNKNDVLSTFEFFKRNFFETELRVYLSQYYNLNLLNSSEPNMVKKILLKLLSKDMDIPERILRLKKTIRDEVLGSDIILPYIELKDSILKKVYDYFYNLRILNTDKKGENSYDFVFNTTKTSVGLGGIHGCTTPGIYKNAPDLKILDIDVTSFYPNIAIKNNITPEHLGDSFLKRYEWFFTERKKYPKSNPLNYIFKICLNTIYGLSKEENSFLYDPKYTYSTTINGQLLLLMLAEKLNLIPGIVMYQLNTDGITVGYNPIYEKEIQKIFVWFNKMSQLSLEYAEYSQINIIDVNNYSAKTIDGKIKRKGLFAFEIPNEVDYHKNPSLRIIPKTLDAYLFKNINPREYIESYIKTIDDVQFFFAGIKSQKDFNLNLYSLRKGIVYKELQEKVCRFLVENTGGSLIKDYNDKRQIACFKYRKIQTYNNLDNIDLEAIKQNIKYDFYVYKVKELIDVLEQNEKFINYLNEL